MRIIEQIKRSFWHKSIGLHTPIIIHITTESLCSSKSCRRASKSCMPTNRQIVIDFYIAANARDHKGMAKHLSDQVRWIEQSSSLAFRRFANSDELIFQILNERKKAWNDYRLDIDALIDGGNRIVGIGWIDGVYRATGSRTRIRFAHIWEFFQGKIVSFEQITGVLIITDS